MKPCPALDIRNLSIDSLPDLVWNGRLRFKSSRCPRSQFSIVPGEVLGLVGESGSGKSISPRIMRLLPPQQGFRRNLFAENGSARNLATLPDDSMRQLRGSRLAMIFQEPMTALNPVMPRCIRCRGRDGSRLRFKKRGPETPSKP